MIVFHRVLIGTAILFCAGFTLWTHQGYQTTGQTVLRILSGCFAVATVALSYYLIHLRRFLGR